MKKRNILKGASVSLIAAFMILSTFAVTADTNEQKLIDTNELFNQGTVDRDDIIIEGFEGVWEPDPDGDPDYMVPVDPVYGKWDVDGLQHGSVSGYPGLTWYWSQFEDNDHPTLDLRPPVGTYWAGLWWDAVQDEWFITPDIDVSLYSDLQLEFLSAYTMMRYGASPSQHDYIKVSTDQGENWDIVGDLSHDPEFDFNGCTGGPAGDPSWNWCEFPIIIDLSDYDGSDSLMIAWNYVYDGNPPAGVWLFDEVELTGTMAPPPEPDLDCDGALSWTDVTPGETVTGTFTVENIGDPESLLDWEIDSYPTDWGTFTFDPNGGIDLTPEDGAVTVTVEVVAPEESQTEFDGEIVLVNSEDPADTCTINVALATPVSQQSLISLFFEMFAQRFPIIAQIIAALF
jgi:hypothetical protein